MGSFSVWHWIVVLIVGPMFGLLNFLPTIIAISKQGANTKTVAWINALLGWTVIGWLVALIMALSSSTRSETSSAGSVELAS